MHYSHIEKPEAVLFDWDGTLVNTIPGLRLAHNHVRQEFDMPPWTEEEFYRNMKYSSRDIYPKIYGDESDKAISILMQFLKDNHLDHLEVLPGSLELLNLLKKLSYPTALISNKIHEFLLREVSHIGCQDYFFTMVGAGKASRDKPHADPLVFALEKHDSHLNSKNIWYVGDTVTDMLAARNLGCHAVLLTHGKDRNDLVEEYNPLLVANDCGELGSILEKIHE